MKEINEAVIKMPSNSLGEGVVLLSTFKDVSSTKKVLVDIEPSLIILQLDKEELPKEKEKIETDDDFYESKYYDSVAKLLMELQRLSNPNSAIMIIYDDYNYSQLSLASIRIFGRERVLGDVFIQNFASARGFLAPLSKSRITSLGKRMLLIGNSRELNPLRMRQKQDFYSVYNIHIKDGKIRSLQEVVQEDEDFLARYGLEKDEVKMSKIEEIVNNSVEDVEYFYKRYGDYIYYENVHTVSQKSSHLAPEVGEIVKIDGTYVGKRESGNYYKLIPLRESIAYTDEYNSVYTASSIRGNFWDYSEDQYGLRREGGVLYTGLDRLPTRLIRDVIKLLDIKDGVILDLNSISGAAAQAVLEYNEEADVNNKFILVVDAGEENELINKWAQDNYNDLDMEDGKVLDTESNRRKIEKIVETPGYKMYVESLDIKKSPYEEYIKPRLENIKEGKHRKDAEVIDYEYVEIRPQFKEELSTKEEIETHTSKSVLHLSLMKDAEVVYEEDELIIMQSKDESFLVCNKEYLSREDINKIIAHNVKYVRNIYSITGVDKDYNLIKRLK